MAEAIAPVAILAGGLATRMYPVTLTIPKSMIEVAGEPFISHQLRMLAEGGAERVVICAGHLSSQIEDFVGDGRRFGCEVSYSNDGGRALGTGGALRKAVPLLGPEFMVIYGDSYLPVDMRGIYAAFQQSQVEGLMTIFRNEGRFDTSNVLASNGRVIRYDKRTPTPEMKYIDYGLSVLRRGCLLEYALGQPFDLANLYSRLASRGGLASYEVFRRFFEIGSPAGLAETRALLEGRSQGGEGAK